MAETVIQATDTTFARQGYSLQQKGYALPSNVNALLTGAMANSAISTTVSGQQQSTLYALMLQNLEIIPGGLTLFNVQSLVPGIFSGVGDLQAIWQRDPWGTDFEDETEELYARSYAVARAAAQSGPTNVRGGTDRQALELSDLDTQQSINRFREIWQNQLAVAQQVVNAVQVHNAIENDRWKMQMQAQQLQAGTEQGKAMQALSAAEQVTRDKEFHLRSVAAGGEFFGVPRMRTDEDMRGVGFQSGVTTNFGMSYWK